MIRFKNFENFNGEKKSLSIDMMIVQYVNPARKAHLLTSIEDFRKAWRPPDNTGGPPLTRKSLTRFPLTHFLTYVRVSGGISVSRGPQYSPTNTSFM